MRAIASIVLVIAVTGCESETACSDPGGFVCSGNAVQECLGPDDGGDEDGDLVVRQACAGGTTCWADIMATVEVGGCVPDACYEVHSISSCFMEGSTTCTLGNLFRCNADENGCLSWGFEQDCGDTGTTCMETVAGAACVAP